MAQVSKNPEEGSAVNWVLSRVIREAHQPGPRITMPDGSVTFMGVRGLTLTEDKKTLLSAGADGIVQAWDIRQTVDDDPASFRRPGMEVIHCEPELKERGKLTKKTYSAESLKATVAKAAVKVTKLKDMSWRLSSPYPGKPAPMLRAAESRPGTNEFVVGTYDCEIWLLRCARVCVRARVVSACLHLLCCVLSASRCLASAFGRFPLSPARHGRRA